MMRTTHVKLLTLLAIVLSALMVCNLSIAHGTVPRILAVQHTESRFWYMDYALTQLGIPHTNVRIDALATVNLSDYDIILVGSVIGSLEEVKPYLDAKASEIESWCVAGGSLGVFPQCIGAKDFDLNGVFGPVGGSEYYDWMPGNPHFETLYSNEAHIVNSTHRVTQDLTDYQLSGWYHSPTGFFQSFPGQTLVVQNGYLNRTAVFAYEVGMGRLLGSAMGADSHTWTNGRGTEGKTDAKAFLSNVVCWLGRSEPPVLGLDPETYEGESVQTFTVNVTITDAADLYGYEFKLNWDPAILELLEVRISPPAIWADDYVTVKNNITASTYWHALTALPPALPFNGSTVLASLRFGIAHSLELEHLCNQTIETHVWLSDTVLADSSAIPIYHITTDCTARIRIVLIGDLNGDGVVNILDIVKVAIKYGQSGPPGWIVEDVNRDGYITILDIVTIAIHYGEGYP